MRKLYENIPQHPKAVPKTQCPRLPPSLTLSSRGHIERFRYSNYFGEDGLGASSFPRPPPLSTSSSGKVCSCLISYLFLHFLITKLSK